MTDVDLGKKLKTACFQSTMLKEVLLKVHLWRMIYDFKQ